MATITNEHVTVRKLKLSLEKGKTRKLLSFIAACKITMPFYKPLRETADKYSETRYG